MTWLTAQVVEELQYLLPDVDRIGQIVATLQGATLPGIMEYGCLRWANQTQLPPLPQAITCSPLGAALDEVRSVLGLRASGPPKRPIRRADVQPAEFHVIESQADLRNPEWDQYILRFDHSTRSAGFSVPVASRLQLALCEMADNAVLHANSPVEALVGYQVMDGISQFCIVDVGIGVLRSLTGCPDFAHLRLHNEAIKAALRDGVSSRGTGRGGFGFRRVFKALASQWGVLRFRSGEGCIGMDGHDLNCDLGTESYPPLLPGFQVSVCCKSASRKSLSPMV